MADKILFISNGYGEDTIAASIIHSLRNRIPGENIIALPLVGTGGAYGNIGVEIAGPVVDMPSGGLVPEAYVKNLSADFASGLGGLIGMQIKTLRRLKKEVRLTVAVGDTYPVLMGGMFSTRPLVFVGTAKSDYFVPYSMPEILAFKCFCALVMPRDDITAATLEKKGVNAIWVGNAMMDCLDYTGENFGIPPEKRLITLLPGSRDFAYGDFPVILNALSIIDSKIPEKFAYSAALAGSIEDGQLAAGAESAGFAYEDRHRTEGLTGILKKGEIEVLLLRKRFADSIKNAFLVIGQAGTGNEQAAGLGKPVVAFDSHGRKNPGWYRARQMGLLGDAMVVADRDPESIAENVISIIKDKEKYSFMSETGMKRLGPPGGAGKMADKIFGCYMDSRNYS